MLPNRIAQRIRGYHSSVPLITHFMFEQFNHSLAALTMPGKYKRTAAIQILHIIFECIPDVLESKLETSLYGILTLCPRLYSYLPIIRGIEIGIVSKYTFC